MQIKIECSNCKKEFTVGGEGVEALQRDIQSYDDNKMLTATYFYCPECHFEHIVQLDDEYTKDLLEQTIAMMKQRVLLGRTNKKIGNKLKKKFRQTRTLLTEYRNGLMAKYNGTGFVEESGIEFELHCVTGFVDEGGGECEQ